MATGTREKEVEYEFSSALTRLDPATGKYVRDEHREQVLPIRGRLMDFDGIFGCFIARYGVQINFIEGIVDPEALDAHVRSAFDWASEQAEFFPYLKEGEGVTVERK